VLNPGSNIEEILRDHVWLDTILNEHISSHIEGILPRISWDRLPSSSKFGLIQFAAELDDTLALFTLRFWRRLSYGSFTWGVLPFVNDIKNILETVDNFHRDLSSIVYEDAYEVSLDNLDTSHYSYEFRGSTSVHLTGAISLEHVSEARLWLDRLGLHPDIATTWDLVPLSFVVDWLLPIGSFLESLIGRGWVNNVLFEGWATVHYDRTTHVEPVYPQWDVPNWSFTYERFLRTRYHTILPTYVGDEDLRFTLPNVKQLFNTLYIFVLSKKGL
jgi:hypothetical protein